MKITPKTKIKDITPVLTDELFQRILNAVEPVELETSVVEMTIDEYSDMVNDLPKFTEDNFLQPDMLVVVGFGRIKQLQRELDNLGSWLNKFKTPLSKDEKQASTGIEFPSQVASMLITVTEFFGLKSFKEAEQVKLCDYLLIYQHRQTQEMFQRNYNRLKEQQQKLNNVKHRSR